MPRELALLLVDEGVVSRDDVEAALARQREAGGALDTALLELGLVSEEQLSGLLSRASDLPAAPPTAYQAVDARARRVFPSKVAERHGLAPFALDGRELSLVAVHPLDLGLLDELSFMLSLHLTAHVGPEHRVRALIHRLYGAPLPPRLAKLGKAEGARTSSHPSLPAVAAVPRPPGFGGFGRSEEPLEPLAAALAQAAEAFELDWEREALAAAAPLAPPLPGQGSPPPPAPAGPPPALTPPLGSATWSPAAEVEGASDAWVQPMEVPEEEPGEEEAPLPPGPEVAAPAPDAPPTEAPPLEEPPSEAAAPGPLLVPEPWKVQPPPGAAPPANGSEGAAPGWTTAQARAALAAATTRDEVVQAALRYARDFFEFTALFAVTGDAVAGHDALGPEDGSRDIARTVALYTTEPGILRTALETLAPYLGPVDREAAGSAAVLDGLARGAPRTTLVYPILLRGRPICLLYADNGEAPVSARRLGDLLMFLSTVGGAFERIIRARKVERPSQGQAEVEAEATLEPLPEVEADLAAPPAPAPAPEAETAAPSLPAAAYAEAEPVLEYAPEPRPEPELVPEPGPVAEPTAELALGQLPEPPADLPEVAPPAPPAPAEPAPDPLEEAFFTSAPGAIPPEILAAYPEPTPGSPPALFLPPLMGVSATTTLPPALEESPEPSVSISLELTAERPLRAAPAEPAAPAPVESPEPSVSISLDLTAERPLQAPTAVPASTPASTPAPARTPSATPTPTPTPAVMDPPLPSGERAGVRGAENPAALVAAYLAAPRGSDERAARLAALVSHAEAVAPLLCQALPGPLEVPPAELGATDPAAQGPVLAAVAALGPAAVRPLLELLGDASPDRRRAACALLGLAGDAETFVPLCDRCFDQVPVVAEAARIALARHRRDPAMKVVPERLRRALLSGLADRAAPAARALAALRDPDSIPILIQALEGSDAATAAASAAALAAITLQRHGTAPRAWLLWWKQNRGRSRAEWLFGALTAGDRDLRLQAAAELRELAASPVAYSADLPEAERHQAAQAWASWFERAGHQP